MSEKSKKSSADDIRRWVLKDLESSVSFLNMLRNDPELLAYIQSWVVNRVQADEERKEMQPELFPENGKE